MNLKDKVVVVTGSSSNIGQATALAFAKEGAKVVINSRRNIEGGEETVNKIIRAKGNAIYIQADVLNENEAKKLIDTTVEHFCTIDILINNAGITGSLDFESITKEHLIEQFSNNFFGTVFTSQYAAKVMKKQKSGKILNTASIRGISYTGREGIIGYSSAKAAVINFTKTLAKELAPDINVNAVAPGFVYTKNYEKWSDEQKQNFIAGTYTKKWVKFEDISNTFIFLAKNDAITGQIIVVDGGYTLK